MWKNIFSVKNKYRGVIKHKIITILGIKISIKVPNRRLNTIPYQYKVNSKYLHNKEMVDAFELDQDRNDLYNYFLASREKTTNKPHHYFHIYNKHFQKFRNKPVHVLEIGVCKGGSLKMWKNYFGEKAQIYGVDIDPACMKYDDPKNGIHVLIADQSNRDDLKRLVKNLPVIDIVIDDGGHTTNQQITSFDELYDKISEDGIYLVEDLCTNYWKPYIDSSITFVEYAKEHIDALNAWYFDSMNLYTDTAGGGKMEMPVFTKITHSISFYNQIIVFEKKRNHVPFAEYR